MCPTSVRLRMVTRDPSSQGTSVRLLLRRSQTFKAAQPATEAAVEAGGALWLRKREHLPADRRLINLDRHSLPVADGELTMDERDLLLCLIRDERPPDRLRTRAALTAAKR